MRSRFWEGNKDKGGVDFQVALPYNRDMEKLTQKQRDVLYAALDAFIDACSQEEEFGLTVDSTKEEIAELDELSTVAFDLLTNFEKYFAK
jgi:hypothetical protein